MKSVLWRYAIEPLLYVIVPILEYLDYLGLLFAVSIISAAISVWGFENALALAYLHGLLTIVTLTEDSKEGIQAFREKRDAKFVGR